MLRKKVVYILGGIGIATALPRLYSAVDMIVKSIISLIGPSVPINGFDTELYNLYASAAMMDSIYMLVFTLLSIFVLYLIVFEKPIKLIWGTYIVLFFISVTHVIVQFVWLKEAYSFSTNNFLMMQLLTLVVHYGLVVLMFVLWNKQQTTYATIVLFVLVGLQVYSVGTAIVNIPSIQSVRLFGYLIGFVTPLIIYILFWNKMYQEQKDEEMKGIEVYE